MSPPTIEVEVPDFNPPPRSYAVTVKPLYGTEHEGHTRQDNSYGHEDGNERSRSRPKRPLHAQDDRTQNDFSQDNGDQSRGIGDFLSNLQKQMHRTGLNHYREFRGRPLAEVFKSLGLCMPNAQYMPSKCTGNRKALCIGINYEGQHNELKGCVNDAHNVRRFLMQSYKFRSGQIMMLTDDTPDRRLHPTRQNMVAGMKWLVEGARPHDSLFIHYSGHGGQKHAEDDQETDGLDEVIFPLDFKQNGDLVDNDLHKMLVQPLPPGCRLTGLFDCCHSGTVLDLPYLHSAHGRIKKTHISRRARTRGAPPAEVVCFSACKDDETSADTFEGGMYVGAMSYGFIKALKENPNQTCNQVLESARTILRPKYKQKPQIGTSNPMDLEAKFIL